MEQAPGPISPVLPGAGPVLSHSASSQGSCLSVGCFIGFGVFLEDFSKLV